MVRFRLALQRDLPRHTRGMTGERTSWTRDDPITSSFAHPRGLRGRLAALIMAATSGLNVTEVAALVPLRAGQQVLEVGYGPGTLLAALHNRPEHPRWSVSTPPRRC